MDWLAKMNAAIAYVEDNLNGEISYEELGHIACCSFHNFFRIFSFITDTSLSDYIRKRRLTLAALELQEYGDSLKVIDLAIKYGYDSPVSFARAFQQLHGVTPTEARMHGVTLKAYPRISFQISIKGEKEMDYRIETREAFQVFGVEELFSIEAAHMEENSTAPSARKPSDLWADSLKNGVNDKLEADAGDLPAFVDQDLSKVHAVCDYREVATGLFPYMLCAFRTHNSNIDGYKVVDIPAHTWAIFPTRFRWEDADTAIGSLYKRIFSEWIPTSSYEQVGSLDMELYGGDDEYGYIEIWLAVIKK